MVKEKKDDCNPEVEDCPPVIKKFNPWIKLAGGILTIILLVGGVIWGMTTTFAMKPEVIAVKVEGEKQRQLIAEKSVETFNIFQRSYRNDQRRSDIRDYTQLIEDSRRRERYIREDLQRNPNSQTLQNRLQEELRLQDVYRQKRDNLLSN